ncbi:flagellar hook assembly protein FlgD [Geobacter sulfurreducens]|uniref:Basal-body rod modification protein FlgD n=1 Tax=Geobacter sulfurreducens (strain ATCC 51573 / DSM 12127 / PCA) TaxID=243231 RepID=Q74G32_GEOSL|nr:flagellar hook assembly protein FlgD [Geobacter sulfurreducens]AAR33749.1 flagellar hook capping protein FlgD [Geobacter sulfurreducens PCA]ADI83248.1 flagellar hook capping protein FlgD [Geobacter sulfurreducens KN400]AJY70140.1 flagellar hook capping protein [Geobacter sulfurreducens]UAC04497.1 flagellar hook assembly protein FlgD [Geobacter sulfurreducens]UTG93113.1 flagellar hook assembly protein FlgD [Geobacter sulfurreducens]
MVYGVTNDTAAAAAAMKKSTGMNKDDFLKLFVTQLQNQDPLNPQDSTEFIGQLAQLTQVEQAYNTNSNLSNLLNLVNGATSLSAVSFIGKEITASGDLIKLTSGTQPTLGYRLPATAQKVTIKIMDDTDTVVRTLTLGGTQAGDGSITWDGKDEKGNALPDGRYTFSVTGTNAEGKDFDGAPLLLGRAEGVMLEGEEPYITIGGINVPLGNILSVKGA